MIYARLDSMRHASVNGTEVSWLAFTVRSSGQNVVDVATILGARPVGAARSFANISTANDTV